MRRIGIIGAMREAIAHEMRADSRVFVMGEDVELAIWGYTRGLVDEFGTARVRNTPISEVAFTGAAVGAAATGLRPVVDLMVANFMYTAMDQIANQIAKFPYVTDGNVRLPLVLVAAAGAAGGNAAQHSDMPVAQFVNIGMMTVICPSTPEDAAGLLTAAIRAEEPVVYVYPAGLGARGQADVRIGMPVAIGSARVRQPGTDVTVWAYGLMAHRAVEAAAELEGEGISVEVVDARTLSPLDLDTVLESVAKTHRLVACDESRGPASMASEVVARVCELGFSLLTVAPVTVTAPPVPVPYAPVMETFVVPSTERIKDACRTVTSAETLSRPVVQ